MSPPTQHIDREFQKELQALRDHLLRMGGRVEEMVHLSVQALVEDDMALAERTIRLDNAVNQDERDIDERCVRMLARWQPMASDLRLITFGFKVVTDFERVGDLAVNICERAQELHGDGVKESWAEIAVMAGRVTEMLTKALDAFSRVDDAAARAVIGLDDAVDDDYHRIFRGQLERVRGEGGEALVQHCIRVQNVCKSLERIGDHCTNIAERTVFLAGGTDLRYTGPRGVR